VALCVPRIAGARVLGRGDHDSADTCYVHFRSAIGLTTRNRVADDRRRSAAGPAPTAPAPTGKVPRNFLDHLSLNAFQPSHAHAARHPKDSQ